MKPLDGARLKIVRAQKHLDCLRNEILAYSETKPYTFPLQISSRIITTGSARSSFEPSLELGLIFGDCLNNLRTSLDYIAWDLATKFTPDSLRQSQGNSIYFPLQKKAGDFQNRRTQLETFPSPQM